MNRIFLFATLAAAPLVLPLSADSGGPYLAVPDATAAEKGPVFQIPQEEKPLRHFLTHMPEFQINQKLQEPENYTWKPLVGYYAALTSLGYAGGQELFCIRYIPDKKIDQGLAYADSLLVVGRINGSGPNSTLCVPIIYATAYPGNHDDWTANYLKSERFGGFKVTGFVSGTGGFRTEIFVRWQDGKFVRFRPEAPSGKERPENTSKASDPEEATE